MMDEYTVPTAVVTFDAGQTLVDLDLDFLALRLGERGVEVQPRALVDASPAAWRDYEVCVAHGGQGAWQALVRGLLSRAGIGARVPELVEWLWQEQPTCNLWRKPIAAMVALARELRAAGVRVAVVSNSEGGLAQLLADIGLADAFEAVIDSRRVGVEKPDPRIFALALERLGIDGHGPRVHIGDSWAADIEGALAAGWRGVWYRLRPTAAVDTHVPSPRVAFAHDVAEVRAALRAFGAIAE